MLKARSVSNEIPNSPRLSLIIEEHQVREAQIVVANMVLELVSLF